MKKVELLGNFIICLLVPALMYAEFAVLNTNCSEFGVVEVLQEFALLSTILLLFRVQKDKNNIAIKMFFYFLIVLFIREFDFLFDLAFKGLWFLIAIIVFGYSMYELYKSRSRLVADLTKFSELRYTSIGITGLTILLFFSRLFGTGRLWKIILKEDYSRMVKAVVQEGLELYGYLLILLSVVLMYIEGRRSNRLIS